MEQVVIERDELQTALMSPPGELLMGLNTKDSKQLTIHRLGGFKEEQACFQLLISSA